MLKAFLSHSSKDKYYVEKVAENLTTNWCVYDTFSFEEASKTAEEIVRYISNSDIFVFFISLNSLESEWVTKELEKVYELMNEGDAKKVLPIIIDNNITYSHPLIPQWMKDNYNIQPIRKYKKAIHRIKSELLKLSWKIDSTKKYKDTLFVGRNILIDKLEGIYRENVKPPMAIVASGLNGIGRRSLIREYMQKVGIADKSKYSPVITLESNESIEDFILKLNDLGLNNIEVNIEDIISMSRDEKINLLHEILQEINDEKEIIFIEDNGCLVLPNRELNDWFSALTLSMEKDKKIQNMILSIISKYKLNKHYLIGKKNLYAIDVPELESKEIDWVLKALIRNHAHIELSEDEYSFIRDLLHIGHPEQIQHAVDLLDYEGYSYLYKNSHLLADFNLQKMSYLLSTYQENESAKSLLAMLAKFDFIDYELLYEFIGDNEEYIELLQDFISASICNEIGVNKEIIKLNKAIRDTVRRAQWNIPKELENKIKKHITNFLKTYTSEDKSLSDYIYSIQEILINQPEKIDITTIFPSHILKTISTLYDVKKKWRSVISLAKDALYENFNNLDIQIENQIRQYLCLAYIRDKKNDLFLEEVQKVQGSSHDFLLGFYYRTNSRFEEALDKLQSCLSRSPNFIKAKRELVQVYLSTHDYATALGLAEEHYNKNKQSPYSFQAYATCLIKTYHQDITSKKEKLDLLFENFKPYKESSKFASEAYDIEYAKYIANQNNAKAIDLINDAITTYSESIYPCIAKFDISERLNDVSEMEKALSTLKKLKDKLPNKTIIIINEAILYSRKGNSEMSKITINRLQNYPEKSKRILYDRLGLNGATNTPSSVNHSNIPNSENTVTIKEISKKVNWTPEKVIDFAKSSSMPLPSDELTINGVLKKPQAIGLIKKIEKIQ